VAEHEVRVAPIPSWVDAERLLGPTGATADAERWRLELGADGRVTAHARMSSERAADVGARLRGLGLDGLALVTTIEPPLRRAVVRQARTEDARRRRATTPGFLRPGARFDDEGRWSLTPEALAMDLAKAAGGRAIVDAGCGLGGNAIAFARAGCRVHAIEADRERLALARHNAGIYGVADRIGFVHGDAIARVDSLADPEAILFVDPPWGSDWDRLRCTLADLPLLGSLLGAASRYAALWAKLPPSFAVAEFAAGLAGGLGQVRARAYFGAAEGDFRRIKFVLVELVPDRRP
jgi:predicted RNA methylase